VIIVVITSSCIMKVIKRRGSEEPLQYTY
jgi:hypothetical protein